MTYNAPLRGMLSQGIRRLQRHLMTYAGVSELADEADSKSVVGNYVWVRVPPPAVREHL